MTPLRLGSRGSQLALFQARLVAQRIQDSGGPACEIVVIRTSGDRLQDAPLSEIGGKRLFVKELEDALLRNDIDLAVHSSKDMSAELPKGLAIGGVLPREDPADVIILPAGRRRGRATLEALRRRGRKGMRIGTGSVRRVAQLWPLFPEATFHNVRGNVETRLRKLDGGEYDLLVLAAAGLRRLGYASRISVRIPLKVCIPAPGQGIIAVEIRSDDRRLRRVVARINDADAAVALDAERALVVALGGGCQMPVGALATPLGRSQLKMQAIVAAPDTGFAVRSRHVRPRTEAGRLGREMGEMLLREGAVEILNASRTP